MPIHIQPHLRSLEKAVESLGMIKALNSVGYNVQVAEENAGTRPPAPVPVGAGFSFLGQKIAHSK